MDDLVSMLNHLNLSPLLTVLLVALFAALRWIGQGLIARIETVEREVKRFQDEEFQELATLVQRHTTKIAVVRVQLGMKDDE